MSVVAGQNISRHALSPMLVLPCLLEMGMLLELIGWLEAYVPTRAWWRWPTRSAFRTAWYSECIQCSVAWPLFCSCFRFFPLPCWLRKGRLSVLPQKRARGFRAFRICAYVPPLDIPLQPLSLSPWTFWCAELSITVPGRLESVASDAKAWLQARTRRRSLFETDLLLSSTANACSVARRI